MTKNNAQPINRNEWKEIMCLPIVEKLLNVRSFETLNDFASRIYGAKYTYEGTNYDGILYLLVGAPGKGEILMLERMNGKLKQFHI